MEELDAVDVVSCALAVVSLGSLGCEEVVFGSIPVKALGKVLNVRVVRLFVTSVCTCSEGHMPCPNK